MLKKWLFTGEHASCKQGVLKVMRLAACAAVES
jgi:hypothetical protein